MLYALVDLWTARENVWTIVALAIRGRVFDFNTALLEPSRFYVRLEIILLRARHSSPL